MKGLSSYLVCKKNAREEIIDGNKISILGLNDLIANKVAVNRDIDKDDLKYLKSLSNEK